MKAFLYQRRRLVAECLQAALACLAFALSFLLRFDFDVSARDSLFALQGLPLLLAVKLAFFRLARLRDIGWREIGFPDLVRLACANFGASAVAAALLRAVLGSGFPRSIYLIDPVVCLSLVVGMRVAIKIALEWRQGRPASDRRRVLIFGAGKAGVILLHEIRANPRTVLEVAGFLDDDPQKRHLRIHGVGVFGREQLEALVRKRGIQEVLLALPAATGEQITSILEFCQAAKVPARRVPALSELIENQVLMGQIRDVRLEDLLGRPPVRLCEDQIRDRLAGRTVLVTGAGGSIGGELCRQIARYSPASIVGFDQAETALYQIERELRSRFPEIVFQPEVGSIQNRRRLEEVFHEHRPESVYHAAAYKHVPMMEAHLFEAVENNVFGSSHTARAAAAFGVEDFVLVSSDKAVRPTSVMGATKRLAEMACLASGGLGSATRFMAVRFGNVLGSSGSVIPLFRQQIAAGGPLTVTHPEMRRFFMTISEAAQLVLQAAALGSGGEIFVLNMGQPVRIVDLARKMVLLSGLRPGEDIRIEFSGIRPGEKLYEELSAYEENTEATPHSQIRVFTGPRLPAGALARSLEDLRHQVDARDAGPLVLTLKELVPDYNPSSMILKQMVFRQAASKPAVLRQAVGQTILSPAFRA